MKKNTNPYVMHPCDNCPFRKDAILGWLGRQRAVEIATGVAETSFTCHKTNDINDQGQTEVTTHSRHCAGAALVLQKEGIKNQHMQVADWLNVAYYEDIRGKERVFSCLADFIEHHSTPYD